MDVAKSTIAIVDDDADVLLSARLFLKRYFEKILTFEHPKLFLSSSKDQSVDVVLLDLNYESGQLDGQEGLTALELIKKQFPATEVIVMTAYAEVNIAVDAVKKGAFDFMVKPWQNEKLLVTLMNALQKKLMGNQLLKQEAFINAPIEQMDPLIGESDAMQQIRSLIAQVAASPISIYISGESGSGKELVAKQIHQLSQQAQQAFVSMDFSSVRKDSQEEVLFGSSSNPFGKWQQAKSGTLYLKEITSMDSFVQDRLLQSLKNEEARSIRILSSSRNEALKHGINKELFYKLNTLEIKVPPLRERWEDLFDLVDYYHSHFGQVHQKHNITISEKTIAELQSHSWPGNIRELKQALERAIIIVEEQIRSKDLIPPSSPKKRLKLEDLEKEYILNTLEQCKGNIQQSAQQLGLSRAALYRRIEKYQLSV